MQHKSGIDGNGIYLCDRGKKTLQGVTSDPEMK